MLINLLFFNISSLLYFIFFKKTANALFLRKLLFLFARKNRSFNYEILDWLIEIRLKFTFFYRRKLFIIFENILRNNILVNLRIHKLFFAVLKFWLHIIFITYYIYKSFRLANIVFLAIVCNLFGIRWNIIWRIFDEF